MSFVNCNHQPEPVVRTTDCQGTTTRAAWNLKLSQVTTGILQRPVPHHPPSAPAPGSSQNCGHSPWWGEGEKLLLFPQRSPWPAAWTPSPSAVLVENVYACLLCLCPCGRCALLGWSLSGDDKLPVALPENNFSAHKLGEQLGPVWLFPR